MGRPAVREDEIARRPGWRSVSSILLFLGSARLLASLVFSWYTISYRESNIGNGTSNSMSEQLLPTSTTLSGSAGSGPAAQDSSYSREHLSETGGLYADATVLVLIGAALGAVGGLLAIEGRRPVQPSVLFAIALAAIAISAFGPGLIALEQPSAACSDARGFSTPIILGGSQFSGAGPANGVQCGPGWQFYVHASNGGYWTDPGFDSGPQTSFVGSASAGGGMLS
ncbi:MAG: hypothetical protein ACREC5_00410 [Thermoplasmata archaeon]